jgi:hypothetical protein
MTFPALVRPAAVAVGLALLVGGCSAASADQAPHGSHTAHAGADFPEGPGPDDRPDPALSGQPVPTLPPGDPGTGSGSDSGAADPDHDEHEGHVTDVPDAALVDAETVAALAGGSWAPETAPGERCAVAAPDGATASRSLTLVSEGDRLVQTVSAHESDQAARDAVPGLAERLAGCGFSAAGDPRLGEASVQLTRATGTATELAMVLAVEGATVVLVGTGAPAAPAAWAALADLSLGTACSAGVHGCH